MGDKLARNFSDNLKNCLGQPLARLGANMAAKFLNFRNEDVRASSDLRKILSSIKFSVRGFLVR